MIDAEMFIKMVKVNSGTVKNSGITKSKVSRWRLKILVNSGKLFSSINYF